MKASTLMPVGPKRLSCVLLLAAWMMLFGAGCESMRCNTCPDARNEVAPAPTRV